MVPEFATPDKQEARAKLRELFLRAINQLNGSECHITMHDATNVHGTFVGSDVEVHNVLVKNLVTPPGVIDNVILRASDIIAMEFKDDIDL